MIAALHGENINVPMAYSGTMNRDLFVSWLQNMLVPSLQKGQVVIMDNASIHKSGLVKKMIEKAGCTLMYLPPYSPDFNPIENYWAVMKLSANDLENNVEEPV